MTDRLTVRAIAIGLVVTGLAVVGAIAYVLAVVSLSAEQQGVLIGGLISLGTSAVGATAALLAHTVSQDPNPPAP